MSTISGFSFIGAAILSTTGISKPQPTEAQANTQTQTPVQSSGFDRDSGNVHQIPRKSDFLA